MEVSIWNCGICVTSSESAKSSISGEQPSGSTSPSRRFRAKYEIWRRKSGFPCSIAFLAAFVKLSAAGKLFLEDSRRILGEVQEATRRAERVASGKAGTLRVGFVEAISWHGVVPESFRRFREKQPDAELTPVPMLTIEQVEAVRSARLDAGFIVSMGTFGKELDQCLVAQHRVVLAAPKGHPLTKQLRLRLSDLNDVPFVWLSRRINPAAYDRLMEASFRGGLKSPRIVQEAYDHATMLSLVSCRLGVAWVSDSAKWQCPTGVVLLPVVDLKVPVPFSLIWRKDNRSPLLPRFLEVL